MTTTNVHEIDKIITAKLNTIDIQNSIIFANNGDRVSIQVGGEGWQYMLCLGQLP